MAGGGEDFQRPRLSRHPQERQGLGNGTRRVSDLADRPPLRLAELSPAQAAGKEHPEQTVVALACHGRAVGETEAALHIGQRHALPFAPPGDRTGVQVLEDLRLIRLRDPALGRRAMDASARHK